MQGYVVVGMSVLIVSCESSDPADSGATTARADDTTEAADGTAEAPDDDATVAVPDDATTSTDLGVTCFADFPCSFGSIPLTTCEAQGRFVRMHDVPCEAVCHEPCSGVTCQRGPPEACPEGTVCIIGPDREAFCGEPGTTCNPQGDACDGDTNAPSETD